MGASSSKNVDQPLNLPLEELEIIKSQFQYFEGEDSEDNIPTIPNESTITKQNKILLLEALKKLQKRNLLAGKTLSDYEILDFQGGSSNYGQEFAIYTVRDKKSSSSNEFKSLRRQTIALSKKLSIFKELEFLASTFHKNIIKMEHIFFEKFEDMMTINIVLPHFRQNFISWMLGTKFDKTKKWGRSPNEVRYALVGALQGLYCMHFHKLVHSDLNFANLLIDEQNNQECKITGIGIHQDFVKFFSLSKNNSNVQFVAPENISYKVERAIIDAQESSSQTRIEKTDFFTDKSDIYSFGVLLYQIFIDSSENLMEIDQINENLIEKRINSVFDMQNDIIPDEILTDLTKIIKSCLSKSPNLRPSSAQLLKTTLFCNLNFKFSETMADMIIRAFKYDDGDGITRNYFKARQILEKLSKRNFGPAKFCLGVYDLLGSGGKSALKVGERNMKNNANSARIFFAQQNNKHSFFILGLMHDMGIGFAQDKKISCNLYIKAAEMGHSGAMTALAVLYQEGDGYEKNLAKAERYLLAAAQKGESTAFYTIGTLYEFGHGVKVSHSNAIKYYKMSADLGEIGAKFRIASLLEQKNFKKSIELYKESADAGDPDSQLRLAELLEHGDVVKGLPQDLKLAVHYYKLSGDQCNPIALSNLGKIYFHGTGVKQDFKIAAHYWKFATKYGDPSTQFRYGALCEKGFGMERNFSLAAHHLQIAITQQQQSQLDASNLLQSMIEDSKCSENQKQQREFFVFE